MNPFEKFDIKHLSPSSCNTFVSEPALFLMQKVYGFSTGVGPAAYRGSAVEDGIVHGLMTDASVDECIAKAQVSFAERLGDSDDPKADKEYKALSGFVQHGLAALRPYGEPTSTQGRADWQVEGLAVPLMGYWDLYYGDRNLIIDLKTSHALPSSPKTNHCSQVALYAIAGGGDNAEARLCYLTTKKHATYPVPELRAHLARLERIALTIQRFLSISDDKEMLAGLVAPDTESFYYSDPETRQKAWEIWGI